jgi:alpha-L-fucosidase
VRFTQRDGRVYAAVLDMPERAFGIRGVDAAAVSDVRLLGLDEPVEWTVDDGMLRVTLPERLPVSPAHVLDLGTGARPAA